MSLDSFKNIIYNMFKEIKYLLYMYKKDLALNNLQLMVCLKPRPCKITFY